MNEKIPTNLTSEEQEIKDQEAQYKQYMLDHPERIISSEELRESGPEIAEFEEMITRFESEHSLAELHLIVDLAPELEALFGHDRDMSVGQIESAINDLTPEDAKKYKARAAARKDLVPIVEKLNILEKETNISSQKYQELKAKYKILSRAVGMINSNKVDHNR